MCVMVNAKGELIKITLNKLKSLIEWNDKQKFRKHEKQTNICEKFPGMNVFHDRCVLLLHLSHLDFDLPYLL